MKVKRFAALVWLGLYVASGCDEPEPERTGRVTSSDEHSPSGRGHDAGPAEGLHNGTGESSAIPDASLPDNTRESGVRNTTDAAVRDGEDGDHPTIGASLDEAVTQASDETARGDTETLSPLPERVCSGFVRLSERARQEEAQLAEQLAAPTEPTQPFEEKDTDCFRCATAATCPRAAECGPYFDCVERNCIACDDCSEEGCDCVGKCLPEGDCATAWLEHAACLVERCSDACN